MLKLSYSSSTLVYKKSAGSWAAGYDVYHIVVMVAISYDTAMPVAHEITPIVIDPQSSEPQKPYGIITVDCSNPYEFDDGILVEPLKSSKELYRVNVFAADTSDLYPDDDITNQVIAAGESRYHVAATGAKTYEPMMGVESIQDRHFVQGAIRSALVVSFIVGAKQPPTDIKTGFGNVEVIKNWNYDRFGYKCRYSDRFRPYGRAAALLIHHLKTNPANGEEVYQGLMHVPPTESWRRGAMINQAYMVAANHLSGRLLRDESHLAINRGYDPTSLAAEAIDPRLAYFSLTPGRHIGIGVDVNCRITSPLRRSEDFIMNGLLRARHEGRPLDDRDYRLAAETVAARNQQIAQRAARLGFQLQDQDQWNTDGRLALPRQRLAS